MVTKRERRRKTDARREEGAGAVCAVCPPVSQSPLSRPRAPLSLSHTQKTLFFPPFSLSSPPARLEELRALNRKTFEETGAYMTEEEIKAFRQPRWTDRREFVDDD